ncbi:DUF2510 domain-containing protein [Streptomyces fructofermentans]|uniref:DUF2510 domain-containing protein n=1 Tax=Streptomyces fructofermentans TaxID=152141 RepID=UPI0037A58424
MTTPPGWYRDPSAPHVERWWDGTAWTEHRRTPEAPGQPPTHVRSAPAGGHLRTRPVVLTAAAAVLTAVIVTGAVVLSGDAGVPESDGVPAATGAAPDATPRAPSPSPSRTPADDPTAVVDELNGITLPLLDGWAAPENVSDPEVLMTTPGTYDCPGDDGLCRHGVVSSRTVTQNDETSPEALAKDDISEAADLAYDRDRVDRRPFHGITSHKRVAQGPVAVAGRAGYFVRWRVTTGAGPGGYVQSTVFPSSVGAQAPIVVRYVFDAGEDGPPLADMDRITKGIRAVGDADTGGGVGSSIGPSR